MWSPSDAFLTVQQKTARAVSLRRSVPPTDLPAGEVRLRPLRLTPPLRCNVGLQLSHR